MADSDRVKYLRIALLVVGLIFVIGIYSLTILWPSGWSWNTGQSEYLQKIRGIYSTLGVFLLIACRNLLVHLSLIWFYGVVERCARGYHGGAVSGEHSEHGTSLWRRAGAIGGGNCTCFIYAARCGDKHSLRH